MPSGIQTGPARPSGEPRSAVASGNEGEQRRDLKLWWTNFVHRGAGRKEGDKPQQLPTGIFGVALQDSIRYANVAISLYDDEGNSYIYGYVPIVVAKCGVYLKEKATEVEGIFRLSGSEKRIRELKQVFDSPDRYGKGLNWEGYTVHDAANILRRYFNQLPEPIVPLGFYERFRDPIRGHQEQAVGSIDGQGPSQGDFDLDAAIGKYQSLITELPPLNRQLLLYILDLLAVFASKSDLNKMTTANLAAIFQPGLISHPKHDMIPTEYRLSQDVLIFLIEHQDNFLIGMQGTEADAKTVQEVESGPPTPQPMTPLTPGRSKTVLGRSGSTSSAGAESVRKYGGVRRNVSVSSRHSRNSSTVSPLNAPVNSQGTPTGSGVQRSNTVPSKRSPGVPRNQFGREGSGPSTPPTAGTTPTGTEEQGVVPKEPQVINPSPEFTTPLQTPDIGATGRMQENLNASSQEEDVQRPERGPREVPPIETSTNESSVSKTLANIGGLFARSPSADPKEERRKPNKLQKKRHPASGNPSAQSSATSLTGAGSPQDDKAPTLPSAAAVVTPQKDQSLPIPEGTPQRTATSSTLKPNASPAHSYRSHSTATDADRSASEAEGDRIDDKLAQQQLDETTPEKNERSRKRWHIKPSRDGLSSKEKEAIASQSATPTTARESTMSTLGTNSAADRSHTSVSSTGEAAPRKSLQGFGDLEQPPEIGVDKERRGSGPVSWLRGKLQERQEKKDEKARAKSPPPVQNRAEGQPGNMMSLNNSSSPPREQQGSNLAVRSQSTEVQRDPPPPSSEPSKPVEGVGQKPNEVVLQALGPNEKSEQGQEQQQQPTHPPTQQQQ